MPQRTLVVVPHTHWDREWHLPHERFRHRLVHLVDGLLELLEDDPSFRHFTLDGQAIVVDDYLEVRPGQAERLRARVREGRLLVGPWYVLPDEWLVSGEALIRNLRLGLEESEGYGGAMRLGYAPDLFGHVGQLPQIFAGFGFDAACVWRGVGADVDETLFDWEAPDGTRLLTIYLRHGYGNAVHLPLEPARLRRRLESIAATLEPATRVSTLLLMNGSDHVEPVPGLPAALARALEGHPELSAEIGTLPGFLERARKELPAERPLHRGELRSGLRAPLLPGCASARIQQKRADCANDVLLTRRLEPLAAWLGRLGGDPGLDVIRHAWRVALQNHPHDSICGCSVDSVHDEIDVRLERVAQIVGAHLDATTASLLRRVAVPGGPDAGEPVVVWNPGGGGLAPVDGELEIALPPGMGASGPVTLRDVRGRAVPAHVEVLDPGAALFELELPPEGARHIVAGLPPDFAGAAPRAVRERQRGGRLELDLLVAGAAGDFDLAATKEYLRERVVRPGVESVRVRAVRAPRVRLRFADELPGHGLRTYRLEPGTPEGPSPGAAPRALATDDGGAVLDNGLLVVRVAPDGRISLERAADGLHVDDLLRIVSEGDRGDEYDFDPVPGGVVVERPEAVRVHAESCASEARVDLALDYRVPARLRADRRARSGRRVALPVRLTLRLLRGLDRLEVEVEVDHRAEDHRLRLHVRAPFRATRLRVESAFEVASRPIAPPADAFGPGHPAERPTGTSPQRAFAALDDGARSMLVANRGGGEVEAVPGDDGTTSLALTLLRAVGWLSRGDLSMRPGDAGPPLATPGAQVPGVHRGAFAVHFGVEPGAEVEVAQRFAAPAVAFWGGVSGSAPLADGSRLVEIDDPSVAVSALEPGPGGATSLRLWNASAEPREVRVGLPAGASAEIVDLEGRPAADPPWAAGAGGPTLHLRPWQIATVRFQG